MSYPSWPRDLVQFERSGWQIQPQDARRKRQGDAGPPGWRRRFSAVAKTVTLSLVVDRNGKAIFDRFYEVDCAHGSRLFTMPDPSTDGWAMLSHQGLTLLTGEGRPLLMGATWLCSFGDELPVETIVGQAEFRKTFSVVVMP